MSSQQILEHFRTVLRTVAAADGRPAAPELDPLPLSDKLYDIMSAKAANRINARLDDELARKVEQVRKRTKRSLSQIVKESLSSYCDAELGHDAGASNSFQTAGFVGCAEGPADYSSTYKAELTRALRRKT